MTRINFFKNAGIALCAMFFLSSCDEDKKVTLPELTTTAVSAVTSTSAVSDDNTALMGGVSGHAGGCLAMPTI